MWDGVMYLIHEIRRCERAEATTAALAMSFICIDTMAYLGMSVDRVRQGQADFVAWVDAYMDVHEDQPYRYRGLDVYGARIAMLHVFGSEAEWNRQHPEAKRFGYTDGGRHEYNPEADETMVIIGAASFTNDVILGVERFIHRCRDDQDLRGRVEARLPGMLGQHGLPG